MGKIVCEAKKRGLVSQRGKPSIEWYKDAVPQYYCYGYIDSMTDELLEVCQSCKDHVNHSQKDYKKWKAEKGDLGGMTD